MDIAQYTQQGQERLQNGQYGPRASAAASSTTDLQAPRTDASPGTGANTNTQSATRAVSDEGGLFETVLDSVNPLQHIPGVSTAYEAVTGDGKGALASMAGGFLFGGPIGLAAGAANSFLEMLTGNDLMGHAVAMFTGEGEGQGETGTDGVEVVSEASQGPKDPLLSGQRDPGLTLAQYQAFAEASQTNQKGFGAAQSQVAWSDTIWTDKALQQATGLYENTQQLGRSDTARGSGQQRNV